MSWSNPLHELMKCLGNGPCHWQGSVVEWSIGLAGGVLWNGPFHWSGGEGVFNGGVGARTLATGLPWRCRVSGVGEGAGMPWGWGLSPYPIPRKGGWQLP